MRYGGVIIGAGSAGNVLATRLSEDKERSVLLLEAGPDYPDFNHRLVDTSIMPDVVRANTNATIIMMAERIADWIKVGT